MSSFTPKGKDFLGKIIKAFTEETEKIDSSIRSKMNSITDVVYRTATARRPKISQAMQKSMGRGSKDYRVSDPDASAGVPVKTGDLQISIHKEVKDKGGKFTGRIFVQGLGEEYAKYMEFGTSKIKPRSFLRSALHVNAEWIKRKFAEPIK